MLIKHIMLIKILKEFFMSIRTDMAIELARDVGCSEGIFEENFTDENGVDVCRIAVNSEKAAEALGKPQGNYITLDMGKIGGLLPEKKRVLSKATAKELSNILGDFESALVVGLGNRAVTPDSLGPKCCDGVFVTRHIKKHIPEAIDCRASTVSAITPNVLAVTGIESMEIISCVCEEIKPDVIIAVDALSAREIKRIGSSIQITDTGIIPGAGVANRRLAINEKSTGRKVVAIGVPTVAYAVTVAYDVLKSAFKEKSSEADFALQGLRDSKESLVVTPTDIDRLTDHAAKVISDALNLALNPNIPYEDIRDFMD